MPDSLIHFDRVTKSYRTVFGRPRDPVFTDVSLHLGEHEIIGLAGPSGCGKSTLIRMFLGLTEWQGGRIRYRGTGLAPRPAADSPRGPGGLPRPSWGL